MSDTAWTCVRCNGRVYEEADWFPAGGRLMCGECAHATLDEWVALSSAPERFIPRLVPGEFELDDDDE